MRKRQIHSRVSMVSIGTILHLNTHRGYVPGWVYYRQFIIVIKALEADDN